MDRKRRAAGLCLVLILCGCNSVESVDPMGENPKTIEAADWEGSWLGSWGKTTTLKVVDAEKGILRLAWVQFDGESNASLHTMQVEIRESGDWLFANTRDVDHGKKSENYFWGRVKNEEGQITVWGPDADRFRPLVEQKVLPGRANRNDVILGPLTPEHLIAIRSAEHGMLFLWDEPMTLVRIGR